MSARNDGRRLSAHAAVAHVNAAKLGSPIVYMRLLRAAKAGEIPAERDGVHWYIRRADIHAIAQHFSGRDAGAAVRRAIRQPSA